MYMEQRLNHYRIFRRLLVLIFREKLQCEEQLSFMAKFGVHNSMM